MPASEATPLDRVAERSARWLSDRASRRSLLGRVGDRLLTLAPPPPTPTPTPTPAAATPPPEAAAPPAPPPGAAAPPEAVPATQPSHIESVSVAATPATPAAAPTPPPEAVQIQPVSGSATVVATALAVSRQRFATAEAVVLARADALVLAIAAPVAAVLDAPLLAVAGDLGAIADELHRLGSPARFTVGLDLPDTERIGPQAADLASLSVAAADFVRARAGTVRAFAVANSDEGRSVAGMVAASAAVRRFPVMVGTDAARRGAMEGERRAAVTYLVGTDAIASAKDVPGGFPLPAPSVEATAVRLAQLLKADRAVEPVDAAAIVAEDTDPAVAAALAGCGGPVLFSLPDPPPARVFTPQG